MTWYFSSRINPQEFVNESRNLLEATINIVGKLSRDSPLFLLFSLSNHAHLFEVEKMKEG